MRIGIIGLPASGKTTLFNALTRGRAETGLGSGRGAHTGVSHVPDDRLDALTATYQPTLTVPAAYTYVDLPWLVDCDPPAAPRSARRAGAARERAGAGHRGGCDGGSRAAVSWSVGDWPTQSRQDRPR